MSFRGSWRRSSVAAALHLSGVVLLLTGGVAVAACTAGRRPPDQLTHPRLAEPVGLAASDYDWHLPPGFPVPRVPVDNPMSAAKVELGRRLFYDRRLSGNRTQACASCHRQERAFTDGLPRAVGSTGELHPRSALSLANAAYALTLDWADPRLTRLEQQARVPLFNTRPVELGMEGRVDELIARLTAEPVYRRSFAEAFPDDGPPVTLDHTLKALAAFVRTLISGDSPYDRLVFQGQEDALSDSAWRGMRLFFSDRLRCSECHAGFTFSGPVTYLGAPASEPAFHNTGLYDVEGRGGYPRDNTGLHAVTGRRRDMGKFRAPTLRNIAVTAPYMHDGSVGSLEEVIAIYARGGREVAEGPQAGDGRDSPRKSPLVSGFEITPEETADLIAFLRSLTDEAFLSEPRFSDPWSQATADRHPADFHDHKSELYEGEIAGVSRRGSAAAPRDLPRRVRRWVTGAARPTPRPFPPDRGRP
jgi:cytochrome c peroxidase